MIAQIRADMIAAALVNCRHSIIAMRSSCLSVMPMHCSDASSLRRFAMPVEIMFSRLMSAASAMSTFSIITPALTDAIKFCVFHLVS